MSRVRGTCLQPYIFKTTPARSRNMRAIKAGKNRSTEQRLRAHLVRAGVRGWRVRSSGLPGRPDFFFPSANLVIFVDGCFWHGCPLCGHIPRTNREYWLAKIGRNKLRDRSISKALRTLGYSVLRIRECDLKCRPDICLKRIVVARQAVGHTGLGRT
jgi:DNA mismatch endonuclease (patch repair protein)